MFYLKHLKIEGHPVLGDLDLNFVNPDTNTPYAVIAFVGENGCGKTTLLNEINNYEDSEYIVERDEKPPFSIARHQSLFLRQNSLARNIMQEVGKTIDGQDRYAPYSDPFFKATGLKGPIALESKEKAFEILNTSSF